MTLHLEEARLNGSRAVIPRGVAHFRLPGPATTREFAFLALPRFTLLAFSSAIVDDTNGSPVIPARRMGAAIKRPGRVLVEVQSGDSPAEFGEVWVGTGSANSGKLYAASAANRAPLSINTASWGPASGSYRWLNVNRAC